jgi:hypothetical protein
VELVLWERGNGRQHWWAMAIDGHGVIDPLRVESEGNECSSEH